MVKSYLSYDLVPVQLRSSPARLRSKIGCSPVPAGLQSRPSLVTIQSLCGYCTVPVHLLLLQLSYGPVSVRFFTIPVQLRFSPGTVTVQSPIGYGPVQFCYSYGQFPL